MRYLADKGLHLYLNTKVLCVGNRESLGSCELATENDKCFNRLHSGVRSTVERVFGILKSHYGMEKARYLGLSRNRTGFKIMCVDHNIKRGLSIQQASCA
ncbi:MAG: transposase [Candidatus Endonucleobacter bathymodioli]|uniref:Transposase n=1 Tax=Candidatus Endonucleibacter bathymodioli TaxID=539814 RepID=A0AA90NJK0_9GAMM|nr:transposase [Candidatus Endonucleobacter bathymodioli]